jgi:hypothetical protein
MRSSLKSIPWNRYCDVPPLSFVTNLPYSMQYPARQFAESTTSALIPLTSDTILHFAGICSSNQYIVSSQAALSYFRGSICCLTIGTTILMNQDCQFYQLCTSPERATPHTWYCWKTNDNEFAVNCLKMNIHSSWVWCRWWHFQHLIFCRAQ